MSFNSKKMLLSLALALGLAFTAVAAQNKAKPPAKSGKAAPPAASAPAQTTHTAHASNDAEVPRMTVEELKAKIEKKEPITIIDSRSQGSYASSDSKIKGAVRLPSDDIESHLKDIPRDKPVVIYCT